MAKIVINDIAGGYNLAQINAAFQAIEDELNNKVLYRDNPEGEPNAMQNDLDMNGHKLLNVHTLDVTHSFSIQGLDLATEVGKAEAAATSAEADAAAASNSATQAATSASQAAASAASINDTNLVHKTGDESVAGIKTFTDNTIVKSINGGHLAGMRNLFINGGMRTDQRNNGAAIASTGGAVYPVDRFRFQSRSATSITAQRVAGSNGFSHALRVTGASGDIGFIVSQRIEDVNVSHLSGKSVTVSFRASSNSLTSIDYQARIPLGTNNDFTGSNIVATGAIAINSTDNVYSFTFTAPSTIERGLEIQLIGGPLGAGNTFTTTGWQCEEGTVATPFERRSFGLEEILCKRYFERWKADTSFTSFGLGSATSTTAAEIKIFYFQKRIAPTITVANPTNMGLIGGGGGQLPVTSLASVGIVGVLSCAIGLTVAGGGLTGGQATALHANSSTAPYIDISSEI